MTERRGRHSREAGMSLIEVLVAVLIMTAIALGLLPLFTRSVRQNREGANYMNLTNVARSTLEGYLQLRFDDPLLTVPAGQDLLERNEYWDEGDSTWKPMVDAETLPVGKSVRWQRTIQVQQFSSGDFVDNGQLDNPLDGGFSPEFVQLKLVRVFVRPRWGADFAFGRPTPVALEIIKAI